MKTWIEKQKHLIDFTLSSLSRRKVKNLGLLAVYTVIVFALASVMLFSNSVRQDAAVLLQGSPEVTVQRMVAGRHDFIPQSYLETLRTIRGARNAQGRLWGYHYDTANGANYTLMVSEQSGLEAGQVIVGNGVARERGLAKGGYLFFVSYTGKLFKLKIVGILPAESEIVSADLVLMVEKDFREFFAIKPGVFTDIVLNVRNPREVPTVAAKIAQALPDTRLITRDDILRTYDAIFDWRQGTMLVLLSGAVLAFVFFAWEKASGLSAEERREIGILKAIGWETSDVIAMKFWEGALISLGAFLGGYLLAYIHVYFFSFGLFDMALRGWAVLYPKFDLVPHIDGFQIFTLFFFTVFPYTAATIVPIWRAAVVDPDSVMR